MHIVHLYRVHSTCRGAELEDFIMQVSTFYPALQFTYTISQTQIPFLDITLSVSGSRISTSLHCKDADTHNYLHYTSSHLEHFRMVFPTPSSCAFAVFVPRMMTSSCQEMSNFFKKSRGYPSGSGKGVLYHLPRETCAWKRRKNSPGTDIPVVIEGQN